MSQVKELLVDLLKVDGVTAAVIISRDGFVIEGESSSGSLDKEAVGAVVSVGIGSSVVMASELQVGELNQTMLECSKGTVIVTFLGSTALLAVVFDSTANLGNVRFQLKRRLQAIEAAL